MNPPLELELNPNSVSNHSFRRIPSMWTQITQYQNIQIDVTPVGSLFKTFVTQFLSLSVSYLCTWNQLWCYCCMFTISTTSWATGHSGWEDSCELMYYVIGRGISPCTWNPLLGLHWRVVNDFSETDSYICTCCFLSFQMLIRSPCVIPSCAGKTPFNVALRRKYLGYYF